MHVIINMNTGNVLHIHRGEVLNVSLLDQIWNKCSREAI